MLLRTWHSGTWVKTITVGITVIVLVFSIILGVTLVIRPKSTLTFNASADEITCSSAISLINFSKKTSDDYISANKTFFFRNSVKTNYQTGSDTPVGVPQYESVTISSPQEMSIVPAHETDGPVISLEVCKNGYVWGKGSTAISKLYYLNPAGSPNKWILVKDFGPSTWINSVDCSLKSQYLIVGTKSQIWRSVAANGTDDFEQVFTFENNYPGRWSFADKADGTIWMSEYGGDKDGDSDDALRIYRSTNEGAVGSWSKIFDFMVDFPADFHLGIHLHKIIYNPHNDTLYMAHGDTDPNYLYKSKGGTGGNWQKINFRYEDYLGVYIDLQPAAAVVQSNGNILWPDDGTRRGIWVHNVADDNFSYINTGLGAKQFFFDAKVIDNLVYAPTETAAADRNEILVFPVDDPHSFIFIDHVNSGAVGQGWLDVAGKANDGYIYLSFQDGSLKGTKKYKPATFSQVVGLSIDPKSHNQHKDPFANLGASSGGWSTYDQAHYLSTGGKYKDSHMIATGSLDTNKMDLTNLNDPVVFSFWAKAQELASCASGIRVYPKQFQGNTFLGLGTAKTIQSKYVPNDYWKKFTLIFETAALNPSTNKLAFGFTPACGGGFKIDAVYMEQIPGGREKLAQLTREADNFQTNLKNPLPVVNTSLGIIVTTYQFDNAYTYALFEARNSDSSRWIKLVIHNGQVKLIDNSHEVNSPIIQTTKGIPEQIRNTNSGDPPPDIYYWALKFYQEGTINRVGLNLATQRSNLESVTPVDYNLSNDLKVLYDGGSHTPNEEIGGLAVKREIFNTDLNLATIKSRWSEIGIGEVFNNCPPSTYTPCPLSSSQEIGSGKTTLNNQWKQFVSFVPQTSGLVEKIAIKVNGNGSGTRMLTCKITDASDSQRLSPESNSATFSGSTSVWSEVGFTDFVPLQAGSTYRIYCRGNDSWSSINWFLDWVKGKTYRIYLCPMIGPSTAAPTVTPTPVLVPTVPPAAPTASTKKGCYQRCSTDSDCVSGLTCGYQVEVGYRICRNLACTKETDCLCHW